MATIHPTLFLRRVLRWDAALGALSGATLLLAGGALAAPLGLPEAVLRGVGVVLLPWSLLVGLAARAERPQRWAILAIAALNLLWAADSVAVLAIGWVAPTALGAGFVLLQALLGGGFGVLQGLAVRRLEPVRGLPAAA